MSDIARLGIEITPRGVTQTSSQLQELGQVASETESAAGNLRSGWQQFGQSIIAINQAVQLAGRVLRGFQRSVSGLTDAWEANEAAATIVASQIQATGAAAGLSAGQVGEFAVELSQMTGIATEAIQRAQGIQLSFRNIGRDVFPEVTEAAANVATVMGTDIVSAMRQVATAVNAPTEGMSRLSRSGVQFTQAQRDMVQELEATGDLMGAQRIILEELEAQFGGAAVAMRDTARGSRMAFEEAVDSLQSVFGEGIENVLRPGREAFTSWVNENLETIQILAQNAPEVLEIMGRGILRALQDTFSSEGFEIMGRMISDILATGARSGVDSMVSLFQVGAESIVAMGGRLGEQWPQALVNSITATLTGARVPNWIKNLLGIEGYRGWQPFDIDVTFAEGASAALETAFAGLGRMAVQNFEDLRERWGIILEGMGELTAGGREQMEAELEALIASGQAAAEALLEAGTIPRPTGPDPLDPGGREDEIETLDDLIARLEREITLRNASRRATIAYDVARRDVTQAERQQAIALGETLDQLARQEELERRAAEVRRSLMSESDRYLEQLEELGELYGAGVLNAAEYTAAHAALRDRFFQTADAAQQTADAVESLEEALERIAVSTAWDAVNAGVRSFRELGVALIESDSGMDAAARAAEHFGLALLNMLPGVLLQIAASAAASGAWPLALALVGLAAGAATTGGIVSTAAALRENAHGGVYDQSGVTAFASGGIVNSPTVFPFANGVGLMGEAGPEAIMPLQRTPSGDLGVRAVGSGGGSNVSVVINNYSGERVEQRETGSGADRQIEVMIGRAVDAHMDRGRGDGSLRRNYGVRRQPI